MQKASGWQKIYVGRGGIDVKYPAGANSVSPDTTSAKDHVVCRTTVGCLHVPAPALVVIGLVGRCYSLFCCDLYHAAHLAHAVPANVVVVPAFGDRTRMKRLWRNGLWCSFSNTWFSGRSFWRNQGKRCEWQAKMSVFSCCVIAHIPDVVVTFYMPAALPAFWPGMAWHGMAPSSTHREALQLIRMFSKVVVDRQHTWPTMSEHLYYRRALIAHHPSGARQPAPSSVDPLPMTTIGRINQTYTTFCTGNQPTTGLHRCHNSRSCLSWRVYCDQWCGSVEIDVHGFLL